MTGILLFGRSRKWVAVSVISAACAVLILVCGPIGYSLNPRGGYLIAVAAQVPLLAAVAIQASLESPLASKDMLAARSLAPWRAAHVVGLTSVAAITCGLAATQLEVPPEALLDGHAPLGAAAIVRNLFALMGAALIGGALIGGAFGWLVPLAWAILPFLVLPGPAADPVGILTLIAQPDSALAPMIFAIVLWALGTVIVGNDWHAAKLSARLCGPAPDKRAPQP